MERKKRSKGRGWESCYVKKIYGTFGVEIRAYGQKLVKFCTHTHTRAAKLVVEMSHIPSLVRFPRRNRLLSVWVSLISSYVTLGGCP